MWMSWLLLQRIIQLYCQILLCIMWRAIYSYIRCILEIWVLGSELLCIYFWKFLPIWLVFFITYTVGELCFVPIPARFHPLLSPTNTFILLLFLRFKTVLIFLYFFLFLSPLTLYTTYSPCTVFRHCNYAFSQFFLMWQASCFSSLG